MTTATLDTTGILDEIDITVHQLMEVMETFNEDEVNKIPYKDSWTAGQLFEHVTKSTEGITKAIQQEGVNADRDSSENIQRLKNTFMDFSTSLKSPDFIVPKEGIYDKVTCIKKLGKSFQLLKESAKDSDLTVVVHTALGDNTPWELLHFVSYHTQRHLNQLKKIHEAIRGRV